MSKSFVMDDEHWITINGNHVLINEKGEIQSGLGGKFNGTRISKFKSDGPKSVKEMVEKYKKDNDLESAGTAEMLRIKMMGSGSDKVHEAVSNLRAQYDEELEKGWIDRDSYNKRIKSLEEIAGEAWSAEERGERNGKYRVKVKKYGDKTWEIGKNNAERIDSENAFKKKWDSLNKRTDKAMQERRNNINNGMGKELANSFYRDKLRKIDKAEMKLFNEEKVENKRFDLKQARLEKETGKFNKGKNILSKARPKIAERRKAIKEYNQRVDRLGDEIAAGVEGLRYSKSLPEEKRNPKASESVKRALRRDIKEYKKLTGNYYKY